MPELPYVELMLVVIVYLTLIISIVIMGGFLLMIIYLALEWVVETICDLMNR